MKSLKKDLMCPITRHLFNDPVMGSDGYCYERSAIEKWLKKNSTSPTTGLHMQKGIV